jgi:antibiotic biosynthesis monooxygenase (ABM) superfamily enzyme
MKPAFRQAALPEDAAIGINQLQTLRSTPLVKGILALNICSIQLRGYVTIPTTRRMGQIS